MSAILQSKAVAGDYVVADLSLSSWGRKEIAIAETEMPGDRKSTRLNSSHIPLSRMPSSA